MESCWYYKTLWGTAPSEVKKEGISNSNNNDKPFIMHLKAHKVMEQDFFSFIILLQIRWPIEPSPRLILCVHMLRYTKWEYCSLTTVSWVSIPLNVFSVFHSIRKWQLYNATTLRSCAQNTNFNSLCLRACIELRFQVDLNRREANRYNPKHKTPMSCIHAVLPWGASCVRRGIT